MNDADNVVVDKGRFAIRVYNLTDTFQLTDIFMRRRFNYVTYCTLIFISRLFLCITIEIEHRISYDDR
jgi:hypothetical protein